MPDQLGALALDERTWDDAIERAVRGVGVRPVFQPIVDLARGTVVGYEALARFEGGPDAPPNVWFAAAARRAAVESLEAAVLRAIVGSGGLICVSYDGGLTWYPFDTGTSVRFNGIAFGSDGTGFAVGAGGTICVYRNGIWSPASGIPADVDFLDSGGYLRAPLGKDLAAQYGGQLLVLWLDVERAHVLAEQYAIGATPTLLVLRDGEELTRVVGFAPAPLVRVLFEQILADALAPGRLWCPVEQVFEDAVLIPLLDAWGWRYRRQVACPGAANRGRVDILVYDDNMLAPRTLFENKRQIGSQAALQQAATQARRYAEQFGLPTFVVAAPAGLWVYRLDDGQARLFQAYSSLDIAQRSLVSVFRIRKRKTSSRIRTAFFRIRMRSAKKSLPLRGDKGGEGRRCTSPGRKLVIASQTTPVVL